MIRKLLAASLLLLAACAVATAQPLNDAQDAAARNHIAELIDESAALSLPVRVERAFMLTLHTANDALLQGQPSRALTLLRTFTFEVRGVKRAKRLRAEVADALIARAEEAIGALGAPR